MMAKYRIVRFDDGQYGAEVRCLLMWSGRFVDLREPERDTWPAKYGEYCKGTKEQAEAAARKRFPSWVPA